MHEELTMLRDFARRLANGDRKSDGQRKPLAGMRAMQMAQAVCRVHGIDWDVEDRRRPTTIDDVTRRMTRIIARIDVAAGNPR